MPTSYLETQSEHENEARNQQCHCCNRQDRDEKKKGGETTQDEDA